MIMIAVAGLIILVAGPVVSAKGIGSIMRTMSDSYKSSIAADLGLPRVQIDTLTSKRAVEPDQDVADESGRAYIGDPGYREFNDTDYLFREREDGGSDNINKKAIEANKNHVTPAGNADNSDRSGGRVTKEESLPIEGNIAHASMPTDLAGKLQKEAALADSRFEYDAGDDSIPIPQLPLWQGDFEIEGEESPPPDIPFPVFLESDILAEDMIE